MIIIQPYTSSQYHFIQSHNTGLNRPSHHLFDRFKTGQSELCPSLLSDRQYNDNRTAAADLMPPSHTTSGVKSGRWRRQWQESFLVTWTTCCARQSSCREPEFPVPSERPTRRRREYNNYMSIVGCGCGCGVNRQPARFSPFKVQILYNIM